MKRSRKVSRMGAKTTTRKTNSRSRKVSPQKTLREIDMEKWGSHRMSICTIKANACAGGCTKIKLWLYFYAYKEQTHRATT